MSGHGLCATILDFVGPDGERVTLSQLPPKGFTRWSVRQKLLVVAAVRYGTPWYGQLADRCPEGIRRGSDDGAEIPRLITERERVTAAVREAGYKFVSADLEGYSTGSLNRTWKPTSAKSS